MEFVFEPMKVYELLAVYVEIQVDTKAYICLDSFALNLVGYFACTVFFQNFV